VIRRVIGNEHSYWLYDRVVISTGTGDG